MLITKENAQKIIRQRNLCSYMNDTKWNELRTAMTGSLRHEPTFTMRTLFDPEGVSYYGDWNYPCICGSHCESYFPAVAFAIEWVKIRPVIRLPHPEYEKRIQHVRGTHPYYTCPRTVDLDLSEEIEAILKQYTIPYEKEQVLFCIYGYK